MSRAGTGVAGSCWAADSRMAPTGLYTPDMLFRVRLRRIAANDFAIADVLPGQAQDEPPVADHDRLPPVRHLAAYASETTGRAPSPKRAFRAHPATIAPASWKNRAPATPVPAGCAASRYRRPDPNRSRTMGRISTVRPSTAGQRLGGLQRAGIGRGDDPGNRLARQSAGGLLGLMMAVLGQAGVLDAGIAARGGEIAG